MSPLAGPRGRGQADSLPRPLSQQCFPLTWLQARVGGGGQLRLEPSDAPSPRRQAHCTRLLCPEGGEATDHAGLPLRPVDLPPGPQ